MTHDKLLAKIDAIESVGWWSHVRIKRKETNALRAVVELHKPIISSEYGTECEHCELCGVCAPCPTIQVVEKELSNG